MSAVNDFRKILHLRCNVVMVSLLLTLDRFHTFSGGSIVDFEQVNAGWVISQFIGICSPDANLHSCLFDSLHFSVSLGGIQSLAGYRSTNIGFPVQFF